MRGASFFVLRSKKPRELCGREREFQEAFCTGAGVVGAFEGPKAGAGCALPKGRGEKRGRRAAQVRGPHRPGGAVCPAAEGGALRKKGVQKKNCGRGRVCRSRKKAPPPGIGAGRGAGEAGGREKGRKGGGAGPEPRRGFGGRGEGGALASALGKCGADVRPADDARQMMPGRARRGEAPLAERRARRRFIPLCSDPFLLRGSCRGLTAPPARWMFSGLRACLRPAALFPVSCPCFRARRSRRRAFCAAVCPVKLLPAALSSDLPSPGAPRRFSSLTSG